MTRRKSKGKPHIAPRAQGKPVRSGFRGRPFFLGLLALLALACAGIGTYIFFAREAPDNRTGVGTQSTQPEGLNGGNQLDLRLESPPATQGELLDPDQAREFVAEYRKALASRPKDARLHYRLGLALTTLGQREEAIRHYRQALQISPDNPETHNNLGGLLASLGNFAEAAQHFREVVRIDPGHAEGHFNLGNTLMAQKRLEEAIQHYRQAIQLKPDYAKAHNNLSVALKETGKLQEAYKHIHEAMRLKRGEDMLVSEPVATANQGTASVEAALPALMTRRIESRQASERDLLDPQKDGWESEAVAEKALDLLKRMAKLLEKPGLMDTTVLNDIASEEFSCSGFIPERLTEVFDDGSLIVRRRETAKTDGTGKQPPLFEGRGGLAKALADLARVFVGASDIGTHVKVVRVSLADRAVETTAYFDAHGRTDTGTVQQHATWRCRWTQGDTGRLWLTSIQAEDYEAVEGRGPPWLADCTASVLSENPSFGQQLVFGLNHWLPRIGKVHNMHTLARYGIERRWPGGCVRLPTGRVTESLVRAKPERQMQGCFRAGRCRSPGPHEQRAPSRPGQRRGPRSGGGDDRRTCCHGKRLERQI
jgi:Flp pilus assembly protein TadD